VDRLTKSAYFLPVKSNIGIEQLSRLYVQETIRLHGIPVSIVPVSIVSNRDSRFVSNFWKVV